MLTINYPMSFKKNHFKSALDYNGKVLLGYKYEMEVQNKCLNKIKSSLPDHLATHALFCVISGKKVLLYTDSAVWSSQLRFYHHTILQKLLSSNLGQFEVLQFKIIPKAIIQEKKESIKIPSKENIDLLLNQAEYQTNEKLKTALLKLGRTLQNCHTD